MTRRTRGLAGIDFACDGCGEVFPPWAVVRCHMTTPPLELCVRCDEERKADLTPAEREQEAKAA